MTEDADVLARIRALNRPPYDRCMFARERRAVSDPALLAEAMANPTIQHSAIQKFFGFRASESTIGEHRRGRCKSCRKEFGA